MIQTLIWRKTKGLKEVLNVKAIACFIEPILSKHFKFILQLF